MESEHAHLNISHGIADEPKVHSESYKKEIILEATKNIKGAKEQIEKHFHRGRLNIPFSFKPKRIVNQKMYHTV